MIDWLNNNEGFVLTILTFVYVLATIILVGISLFQAKLTDRSIKSASEAERRRYRPHVQFDLYSENITLYASLRNTGASPAFNVVLNVEPEIYCEVRGKKRVCPLIGESLTYLAPAREIRDACAFGGEFDRHFSEPIFTGSILYEDTEGIKYDEKFQIDLRAQRQLLYVEKKDPGKELEKIGKVLQNLDSSHLQPLIRIISENQYRSEQKEMITEAQRKIDSHRQQSAKPNTDLYDGSTDASSSPVS